MKLVTKDTRPNLTIEFTPEELEVLFFVAGSSTGDSEKTGRKHMSSLYSLLREAGYNDGSNPYTNMEYYHETYIHFTV